MPGCTRVLASYQIGDHGPGGFYGAYGFVETGELTHGEAVIRFTL